MDFLYIFFFCRIVLIHKHIRDIYYKKFPELESIVLNPIDYVKCVQKIRNETVYFFKNFHESKKLIGFKQC